MYTGFKTVGTPAHPKTNRHHGLSSKSLIMTAAVTAAVVAGCGQSSSSKAASGSTGGHPVTIGLIVPTSGPLAGGGSEIVAGSQAAVAAWNADHKKTTASLDICNDTGTASGAQQCVYRLSGSVTAFSGPDFATDYPGALPALTSSGKFDVTLAAVAKPTPASTIFVAQPPVPPTVDAMMSQLKQRGFKKVGILNDQEPAGIAAAAEATKFAQQNGMKVATASFPTTATTAVPQVQELMTSSPDAILVWTIGNAGVAVLQAVDSVHVTVPVLMNYFNVSSTLFQKVQLSTSNHVGVLGTQEFLAMSGGNAGSSTFAATYRRATGKIPSWAAAVAGNAVDAILTAAKNSDLSTSGMTKFLESTKTISGPASSMMFSAATHVTDLAPADWVVLNYDSAGNKWVSGF